MKVRFFFDSLSAYVPVKIYGQTAKRGKYGPLLDSVLVRDLDHSPYINREVDWFEFRGPEMHLIIKV